MIRIAAALFIATASSFAAAQDRPSIKLEPGLWRVLIKTSQNGKPQPDKTENRCYSAAEFDDLPAFDRRANPPHHRFDFRQFGHG